MHSSDFSAASSRANNGPLRWLRRLAAPAAGLLIVSLTASIAPSTAQALAAGTLAVSPAAGSSITLESYQLSSKTGFAQPRRAWDTAARSAFWRAGLSRSASAAFPAEPRPRWVPQRARGSSSRPVRRFALRVPSPASTRCCCTSGPGRRGPPPRTGSWPHVTTPVPASPPQDRHGCGATCPAPLRPRRALPSAMSSRSPRPSRSLPPTR